MIPLIQFTAKGLYCAAGDFYIDPWVPVERAVITHAHSDHARPGSKHYLCHTLTGPLLQARLGDGDYETIAWNTIIHINGVAVSLHPAGHVIGSSQIRLEYGGEVWVVSGDYKTEDDGISGAFEPIKCDVFITESTFGLPIYKWKSQAHIYTEMCNWVVQNQQDGKSSILLAYSLGKAQRVLQALQPLQQNVWVHGAVWNIHQAMLAAGVSMPPVQYVNHDIPRDELKKSIVIAPPSAAGSPWLRRFEPYGLGVCSGWMQVRGNVRRRNADAGFVLSDHADWDGLLSAITATGARKVFVTHGFQSAFSRYLNEKGIESAEVQTRFGDEAEAAADI